MVGWGGVGGGFWDRSPGSGVSERACKKLYIPVCLILTQDSVHPTFIGVNRGSDRRHDLHWAAVRAAPQPDAHVTYLAPRISKF